MFKVTYHDNNSIRIFGSMEELYKATFFNDKYSREFPFELLTEDEWLKEFNGDWYDFKVERI